MNLSLRNVSRDKNLSRETPCFIADIFVNDKKIGWVVNNGKGGCNQYHWSDIKASYELEIYAAHRFPKFKYEQMDALMDELLQKVNWVSIYGNTHGCNNA